MQESFASDSKELRALKLGEILEVFEGPRKENLGNAMRARGRAHSDAAVGWFTVTSKQGEAFASRGSSTYTCTANIALTDTLNIKDCKVVRKVEKGETLTVLEGPIEHEESSVTRIRVRAQKDSVEGWITTTGNAGTSYAKETG